MSPCRSALGLRLLSLVLVGAGLTDQVYFSVAPRAASAPHEIQYNALPWSGIVAALLSAYAFVPHDGTPAGLKAAKLSCPMVSPATFIPGETKHEHNVTGVHWLMLDFDDVSVSDFFSVLGRLESEGIAAFSYSTWSQPEASQLAAPDGTVGLVRARVGMPISRPCTPQEWRSVYHAALAKYGATGSDSSCSDPSRFYFVPSLPVGAEAFAQTWRSSGAGYVDVDRLVLEFGGASYAARGAIAAGTDPIPRDALVRLAQKLSRSIKSEELRAAHLIKTGLDGHAFAAMGQRHEAKLTLSMRIAMAFPRGNASQMAEYFRQALDLMRDGSEQEDPIDKFTGLIESAQMKVLDSAAASEGAKVLLAQTNLVKAWEGQGYVRDTPYTPAELDAAVKHLGLQHPSELASRWIIQQGDWIRVLLIDPKVGPLYLPAVSRTAITTSIVQNLAPAVSAGFSGYTLAKDGSPIPKTLDRLISEYGRVVHREELSMVARVSYLDAPRSCVVEATSPLASIDPEYDEEVDEWLALLAGDADPQAPASQAAKGTKAARLADWLAVVTDLREPAPAIFFKGGPGTGKTLLAEGLARLWGQEVPTSMADVLGVDFTSEITRCPLVLGDEKIPETFRGEPRTEELRALITKSSFSINRKNRNIVICHGSVRVICCANNFNMIARKGDFTPEDAQAIADRFILFEPNPLARDYLIAKGARIFGNELVKGLKLAKHVLWLRAQNEAGIRPIERGQRLYVPGDASALTDALQTTTRTPWAICYWLWSFLRNPWTHVTGTAGRPLAALVTLDNAARTPSLWVSSEHLAQSWDTYLQGERAPSREALLGALRNVSAARGEARLRRALRGPVHGSGTDVRVEYVRVRLEALVQWAEVNGEDTSELPAWLSVETESLGTKTVRAGVSQAN